LGNVTFGQTAYACGPAICVGGSPVLFCWIDRYSSQVESAEIGAENAEIEAENAEIEAENDGKMGRFPLSGNWEIAAGRAEIAISLMEKAPKCACAEIGKSGSRRWWWADLGLGCLQLKTDRGSEGV
jgi:hypothetical protein